MIEDRTAVAKVATVLIDLLLNLRYPKPSETQSQELFCQIGEVEQALLEIYFDSKL